MSSASQQEDLATVLQAANRLNAVINALDRQTEELPKQLDSVLAPAASSSSDTSDGPADNPVPEPICPLESTLLQLSTRLMYIHERLRDIQGRLCI